MLIIVLFHPKFKFCYHTLIKLMCHRKWFVLWSPPTIKSWHFNTMGAFKWTLCVLFHDLIIIFMRSQCIITVKRDIYQTFFNIKNCAHAVFVARSIQLFPTGPALTKRLLTFKANACTYQVQSGFGVIIKSARSERRYALCLSLPWPNTSKHNPQPFRYERGKLHYSSSSQVQHECQPIPGG